MVFTFISIFNFSNSVHAAEKLEKCTTIAGLSGDRSAFIEMIKLNFKKSPYIDWYVDFLEAVQAFKEKGETVKVSLLKEHRVTNAWMINALDRAAITVLSSKNTPRIFESWDDWKYEKVTKKEIDLYVSNFAKHAKSLAKKIESKYGSLDQKYDYIEYLNTLYEALHALDRSALISQLKVDPKKALAATYHSNLGVFFLGEVKKGQLETSSKPFLLEDMEHIAFIPIMGDFNIREYLNTFGMLPVSPLGIADNVIAADGMYFLPTDFLRHDQRHGHGLFNRKDLFRAGLFVSPQEARESIAKKSRSLLFTELPGQQHLLDQSLKALDSLKLSERQKYIGTVVIFSWFHEVTFNDSEFRRKFIIRPYSGKEAKRLAERMNDPGDFNQPFTWKVRAKDVESISSKLSEKLNTQINTYFRN